MGDSFHPGRHCSKQIYSCNFIADGMENSAIFFIKIVIFLSLVESQLTFPFFVVRHVFWRVNQLEVRHLAMIFPLREYSRAYIARENMTPGT
jgi:hypothetical protein